MRSELNIPHKAGRILNLILLAFILIFLRVWFLSCIQGEYLKQKSTVPRRKSFIEKTDRATIRDRFNIPMAQNQIDYAIAIRYADIRDLPSYQWITDSSGEKSKKPFRSAYVERLCEFLAQELNLSAQEIEDTIYAKASLFPQTPFVLKSSLSEQEYYHMRSAQKDWVGLEVQRNSKRVYLKGKVACDVLGYMGAINSREYVQIAQEITELEEYIRKREQGEVVFLPQGYENPIQVRQRLTTLKEKAYTIHDLVGKNGVEKSFDEQLRGSHGRKSVEIDPKGHIIRELPGSKKAASGQRVCLSLSAELQEFAEALLAQHEEVRDKIPGSPWIKGGAAVVMHPKTGEVLALASYPRFDPNDFIPSGNALVHKQKQANLHKWLEDETYLSDLWNGKIPLTKETYSQKSGWGEKHLPFTWEYFLQTILSPNSQVKVAIEKITTLDQAYSLHESFRHFLHCLDFPEPAAALQALYIHHPHIPCKRSFPQETLDFLQDKIQESLPFLQEDLLLIHRFLAEITSNDDKLLLLDLLRILLVEDSLPQTVLQQIGNLSLSSFFSYIQTYAQIQESVQGQVKELHKHLGLAPWREKHFKSFLKTKRKEEKEKKQQTRPFTEYLEKIETSLFSQLWKNCKYLFLDAVIHNQPRFPLSQYPELIPYVEALQDLSIPASLQKHIDRLKELLAPLSPTDSVSLLKGLRSFKELNRPLYGRYRSLRNTQGTQLEKHLAAAFYPLSGFGYGRAQSFRQSTPIGSVFKLVVAYEALREQYEQLQALSQNLSALNPLTLIDQLQMNAKNGSPKQILGYTLDGQPIRRAYKGGLLPRSHPNIGKIDLPQAIEQSSNIYFSILASEHIADPSFLEETTKAFGFGKKTGIDLQGETTGHIPDDLSENKTGLYAFAIGQHSLTVTPLQTAVMLSALGNGGTIVKPQIVHLTAGKTKNELSIPLESLETYPFQEPLSLVGIHFPLFTESLTSSYSPCIEEKGQEMIHSIFLPKEIRAVLFDGMNRVLTGKKGTARPSIIYSLKQDSKNLQNYLSLQGQLVGKTGTAEILYKQYIDNESKAEIRNHIWFGGLLLPNKEDFETEDAELAIAIYLRFSQAGGKEGAPLAAQIAKKWKEIQTNRTKSH